MIETIYASTVLSRSIDAIVVDLEHEVLTLLADPDVAGTVEPLSNGAAPIETRHPDIARHVELARRIQFEVGFKPTGRDWLAEFLGRLANPAIAFDAAGAILCRNVASVRTDWANAAHLSALVGDVSVVLKAAAAIASDDGVSAIPIRFQGANGVDCGVVKRAGARANEGWGREVWLLMLADFAIDDALARQTRAVFGLTAAEAAVAVRFVQGVSLEAIAKERAVSLETVRAQVKAIKTKTRSRDLHALVRLFCALSAGLYVGGEAQSAGRDPAAEHPWAATMRTPDGRRLDYLRQGARQGELVLLLHTLAYGAQLPEAAHRYAAERGLRVVAPLRPGYGRSDPLPPCAPSALLDRAADDMVALLDQLGVARARLLGNVAGSSYAVRLASRHPDRISALVLLHRGPVWRPAWLADLTPNHRALAVILRHFPSAGRLVVGAITQHFHRNGPGDYAAVAARHSPPDVEAVADPETLHLLGHGTMYAMQQGPEAYCRDFEAMEIDLTAEARGLPHPITLIIGRHDRIIPPIFAERFVHAVPQTRLIELPDAGHYLLYNRWRTVIDTLAAAA